MRRSGRVGPPPSAADFVARELDGLVRMACGLTGGYAAAEDLVSAAIAGAFERWGSIDNHGPYVRRSVVNLFLNEQRRQRTAATHSFEFAEVAVDPTRDVALELDLQDALSRLTPLHRAVIISRYLDDRSVKETARIVGRPAGSVQRITHEAVVALRDASRLSGYGPPPRAQGGRA